MEILRSQKMEQKVRAGLSGKSYNTIAEEVINKYAVVIKFNGFTAGGVGETEELAISNAKNKIKELV